MDSQSDENIAGGLHYPHGLNWAPEPGKPFEVADGVYWLRMPLPMKLDHINLWLLEDGDGWTLVDTGMNLEDIQDIWTDLFTGFCGGKPVKRLIVTHMHPDHTGLAGWICQRFDCPLWMAREEFLMCKMLVQDTGKPVPDAAIRFYQAAGLTDEQIDHYRKRFGWFGRFIYRLPDAYRRLMDRETISINGRYWQIITGHGHSPEHASLYCPALRLMISGDQVLPRITPNVSVFPSEPQGDPLSEWLVSCAKIRGLLPDDVLVLPSHQEPFIGLHTRLTQIIESHERGMDRLYELLEVPKLAVECFGALFKSKINPQTLNMATGETLAHLNCLLGRKMIFRKRGEDGRDYYQQLPDACKYDLD